MNNFLSNLIQPLYNELGWNENGSENDNYTTTQLRPLILNMACSVGNKHSLSFAGQKFLAWKENNIQISPDLRTVVYSYGKLKLNTFKKLLCRNLLFTFKCFNILFQLDFVLLKLGMKAAAGDQETWDWLFERYRNETNAQEKTKLLRGLSSIEIPWLLR